MLNVEKLCKGCMREIDDPNGICPICGYDNREEEIRSSKCLRENTILNGRYLLGRVLGEGGFGITYLAVDLVDERVVAVKEYFPVGLSTRDMGASDQEALTILPGEARIHFRNGLERFTREGEILSRFQNLPGIVNARDFFFANETAYLVMDYIEGQSLKQYMKWYQQNQNGKPMDYRVAIAFLEPVIRSLIQIHNAGLIHRDISPDNILIDDQGKVTLIDFGSAREDRGTDFYTMTVMVKHGYAPEEQYRTHGKQGPWTDVYALCATLYHMISGKLPMEAVERLIQDSLQPLKQCVLPVKVPEAVSDVLGKGMAVHAADRYQNMEDLQKDLQKALRQQELLEQEMERKRLEEEKARQEKLLQEERERQAREEQERQAKERRDREEQERQAKERRDREERERQEQQRQAKEEQERIEAQKRQVKELLGNARQDNENQQSAEQAKREKEQRERERWEQKERENRQAEAARKKHKKRKLLIIGICVLVLGVSAVYFGLPSIDYMIHPSHYSTDLHYENKKYNWSLDFPEELKNDFVWCETKMDGTPVLDIYFVVDDIHHMVMSIKSYNSKDEYYADPFSSEDDVFYGNSSVCIVLETYVDSWSISNFDQETRNRLFTFVKDIILTSPTGWHYSLGDRFIEDYLTIELYPTEEVETENNGEDDELEVETENDTRVQIRFPEELLMGFADSSIIFTEDFFPSSFAFVDLSGNEWEQPFLSFFLYKDGEVPQSDSYLYFDNCLFSVTIHIPDKETREAFANRMFPDDTVRRQEYLDSLNAADENLDKIYITIPDGRRIYLKDMVEDGVCTRNVRGPEIFYSKEQKAAEGEVSYMIDVNLPEESKILNKVDFYVDGTLYATECTSNGYILFEVYAKNPDAIRVEVNGVEYTDFSLKMRETEGETESELENN